MGIKKGFTLIEMVIVVGVLGFAMPVLFAIIFLIIQQQARIYSLQEVKKQGDIAFYTIRDTIRQYGLTVTDPTIYPSTLYPTIIDICPRYPSPTLTPAPFLFLFDKGQVGFSYTLLDNKIASNSPVNGIEDLFLTNDKVVISDLKFNCYRSNQFSPPIISTSFTATKSGSIANPASLQFNTKFQLRNY